MSLAFPSSPTINQRVTTGGRTYEWNGQAWDLVGSGIVGPVGSTGPTGANGGVFLDVPNDGVTYGRRNSSWVNVPRSNPTGIFQTPITNIVGISQGSYAFEQFFGGLVTGTLYVVHGGGLNGDAAIYPYPTSPGKPTMATFAAGQQATWTAPSNNGGSALTAYRLYVNGDASIAPYGPSDTTSFESFTGGTVLAVSAVNVIGEGPKSDPVTVA
jgi:hypothetical protein